MTHLNIFDIYKNFKRNLSKYPKIKLINRNVKRCIKKISIHKCVIYYDNNNLKTPLDPKFTMIQYMQCMKKTIVKAFFFKTFFSKNIFLYAYQIGLRHGLN